MKMLYVYLLEDSLYNGYLLVTMLLPCLIYQGIKEKKAKKNKERMPAKYYFSVYIFLAYLWMVFKVTGIGLLADITRPGKIIKGGFNWNPVAGIDIGFLLNIIMFLPLGFLMPCIWKKCRNVRYVAALGGCFSMLIEVSQIFNWRATDIDDLIANTLGACLGYVIWKSLDRIRAEKNERTEVNHPQKERQPMNEVERKWEPGIYLVLAFLGAFLLYNPYI